MSRTDGVMRLSAWPGLRVGLGIVMTVGWLLLIAVSSARADFGVEPGSLSAVSLNKDGTVDEQASSHPFSWTLSFKLNMSAGFSEGGELRDVIVKLPAGMVGDPLATPRCTRQEFEGGSVKCPLDTQIGVVHPTIALGLAAGPVFNLVPPPGVAAEIGFGVQSFIALPNASVDPSDGYAVSVATNDIPIEIDALSLTVWGVPADPAHDSERGQEALQGGAPVSSSAELLPFLTLPATCSAPLETLVSLDSKLAPGVFHSYTAYSRNSVGDPVAQGGCESVPFTPQVAAQPTTRNAGSPSGLEFELALPNEGLLNPGGIAETEPQKVQVALPEGMTANPSFAEGIGVCTTAQYEAERLEAESGVGCPETSKLGSVVAHSPLIEEAIEGSLYLAEPYKNQFGSLLAIYMVLRAPERGVLVKQAGHVVPDPVTGQLVTTFEGLPPVPYSTFHLHFREGARAPLVTPPTCGQFQTVAQMTPFSSTEAALRTPVFQIEHGAEGGPCPAAGTPPFDPGLVAGATDNAAGGYSPLELRITRKDGEQEITGFTTQLPEGLTANLTGVPFCTEAEIAVARTKTGAAEEVDPSCPAASQIGHTQVGVGVGTVLAYAPGRMYLGGPFEGAPFSIVSISAAKVGPFDLGTVVVHLPLDVDSVTARVSIPQGPPDQIPHIIDGIVVHVRDIQVVVDREHFTLNPTSCANKTFTATVYGSGQDFTSPADDVPATTNSPFQAAECASLAFKPSFTVATAGKTSRKNGASLHVTVTYPSDSLGKDANIASVKVALPKQLPSRLTTLQKACTARQFETNPAGCPAASRVGTAKAITPILPEPLQGPAYFVSHGGAKFPELVIVLQGYGLTIDLHGETFINEKTNVTTSTFHTVPDQPVQNFELTLPQGPDSALAAIGNLCVTDLNMPTQFSAQNGATQNQNTPIEVTGCPYALTIVNHTIKARKLTLKVAVPQTGQIVAAGNGLTRASGTVKGRETITLTLKQRHAGKLNTSVLIRFTPTTGKQRKILRKTLKVNFR